MIAKKFFMADKQTKKWCRSINFSEKSAHH
jgi:hypothetical protein